MATLEQNSIRANNNETVLLDLMKEGKLALNDAKHLEIVEDKNEQAAIAASFINLQNENPDYDPFEQFEYVADVRSKNKAAASQIVGSSLVDNAA